MKFSLFNHASSREVIELYTRVFSASEGESEGQNIGELVSSLIATTKPSELIGCVATDNEAIVGCIFFSRIVVPSDQLAFILSPVAVDTKVQGTGIGQQLIVFGLNKLREQNVSLVFTYGDPAYYCKTGFAQISEDIVKAPYPLSQPEGWLGQSLDGGPIDKMRGASQCVEALSNPVYW